MNVGQQFLHVLSDPNIAFILFTIGFYGILSRALPPELLLSGSLGAIAIVLAFIGSNSLPLNVGGLLLILLGIGLFVLELHFTCYGLLTIGGVVALRAGRLRAVHRGRPATGRDQGLDQPAPDRGGDPVAWPTSSGSCAR